MEHISSQHNQKIEFDPSVNYQSMEDQAAKWNAYSNDYFTQWDESDRELAETFIDSEIDCTAAIAEAEAAEAVEAAAMVIYKTQRASVGVSVGASVGASDETALIKVNGIGYTRVIYKVSLKKRCRLCGVNNYSIACTLPSEVKDYYCSTCAVDDENAAAIIAVDYDVELERLVVKMTASYNCVKNYKQKSDYFIKGSLYSDVSFPPYDKFALAQFGQRDPCAGCADPQTFVHFKKPWSTRFCLKCADDENFAENVRANLEGRDAHIEFNHIKKQRSKAARGRETYFSPATDGSTYDPDEKYIDEKDDDFVPSTYSFKPKSGYN